MDLRKSLEPAKIPIIALVLLGILNMAMSITLPITGMAFGLVILLLDILVLVYVGYSAVKTYKLVLGGAALSGLLAEVIATAVIGVIAIAVFFVFGAEAFIPPEQMEAMEAQGMELTSDMLFGVLVVSIIISMIIGGIIGAIMGAIGGFIAQKT